MNTQAAELLARVVPWHEEGEQQTFCGIHHTFVPDHHDPRKPLPWSGRACRSHEEAVRHIEYLKRQPTTRDIYFAPGTQRNAMPKKNKFGKTFYKAIRNQSNVAALKSFWLDIDVKGSEHGYDTLEGAMQGLSKFVAGSGLPEPSVIVKSGGGLHVYWTVMRALTVDEWRPIACNMAEATKQLGLRCDTQCTIDCARVLRVPGTKNFKTNPPRDVELVVR
jgi:hypothetical protein